jgi:signal peptidase I
MPLFAPAGTRSRRALRELVEVVVLAVVLYAGVRIVAQPVRVEGFSMETTLDNHDYLVATTIDYRLHPPQRGDIVVLSGTADDPRDLIKRVIGLPGEHLRIQGGRVTIDGRTLNEPYLAQERWTVRADWPTDGDVDPGGLIPAGQYFVMGDNRNDSLDSRFFGPVGRDRILARAWVRVLPVGRAGTVDRDNPTLTGTPTS